MYITLASIRYAVMPHEKQRIQLRVSTTRACEQPWDSMSGDEHVRFCTHCQQKAYNLVDLSKEEADKIIQENEGQSCARFYRRKDGKLMASSSPRLSMPMRLAAGVLAVGTGIVFCYCAAAFAGRLSANFDSNRLPAAVQSVVDVQSKYTGAFISESHRRRYIMARYGISAGQVITENDVEERSEYQEGMFDSMPIGQVVGRRAPSDIAPGHRFLRYEVE